MNGCKFCPAHDNCSVTYRGSSCAAIRYSFGIEDDPEIMTNADKIRAMKDEELAETIRFAECCPEVTDHCGLFDSCNECWVNWLQQPVEEKK